MVKSRIMHDRERKHAGGQRLYKNSIDCAIKVRRRRTQRARRGSCACSDPLACWLSPIAQTLKQEGPFAFYRGWLPSYLRLGPHFIMVRRPALLRVPAHVQALIL